ncbi:MAG: hypothetical protein EA428_08200 [Spirochaetaceae bacterium]|nr:MAG: hypothetical protein EA428_08200 [Spirochaetaceae bacterium]
MIGVAFVDFTIFGGKLPPHSCFELRERSSPEFVCNDHLSLHLLELKSFGMIRIISVRRSRKREEELYEG